VAGAVASGRVPAGGVADDHWSSWLNPTSILGGVLAVTVCAYLAAVYMVWDAHRFAGPEMEEYFRRRAIASGIVAGVVAFAGIFVLRADADYLFDRLTGVALPIVILSGLFGIGSLVLLLRRHHRGARVLAIGAVATVIVAWGVAQWPYLLPESLTISAAAAPDATLASVLIVFGLAVVIILPALGLLYYLDQRSLLDADAAEPGPTG